MENGKKVRYPLVCHCRHQKKNTNRTTIKKAFIRNNLKVEPYSRVPKKDILCNDTKPTQNYSTTTQYICSTLRERETLFRDPIL